MGLKAWQLRYRILQEREQNREEMSPYWMVQLSQSIYQLQWFEIPCH